jgi:hypothetical protein
MSCFLLFAAFFVLFDKGVWVTSSEISKLSRLQFNNNATELAKTLLLNDDSQIATDEQFSNYKSYLLSSEVLDDYRSTLKEHANANFQDLIARDNWLSSMLKAKIQVNNQKNLNLIIRSIHPSHPEVATENLKLFLKYSLETFYLKQTDAVLAKLEASIKLEESIGLAELQRRIYLLESALNWVKNLKKRHASLASFSITDPDKDVLYTSKSESELIREISFLKSMSSFKTKDYFKIQRQIQLVKNLNKMDASEKLFFNQNFTDVYLSKNKIYKVIVISIIAGLLFSLLAALISEYGVRGVLKML